MAPRGSKRASVGGAGGNPKRRAAANPALAQCDEISKALRAASREVLPKEACDMLVPMLRPSLAVAKVERHQHQVAVVDMVGKVLQEVAHALEQDVEHKRAAADRVDADRAERRTKLDEAKAALAALEATVAAKKDELNEAAKVCSLKSAELVTAEKAFKELDQPYAKAAGSRAQLADALKALEFLLGASRTDSEESKAHYKVLVNVCTAFDIESDLAEVVLKCLRRNVADRQSFDVVSLNVFGETIRKIDAQFEQKMKELEAPRAGALEALNVAKEARTAADQARTACHTVLAEARSAEKVGHHDVKVAEKHLAAWWHDTKVTLDGSDDQVKAFAAFREGPLTAFEALRELAPAPEPEPTADEVDAGEPAEGAADAAEPTAA